MKKTADRIQISFGIIGRTGPGMRQVVGLGYPSTGGVFLGTHLGRAIVFNGDFTALVCDSASTVGAAVWGDACGGPRHCCIRWGPRRAKGRGAGHTGRSITSSGLKPVMRGISHANATKTSSRRVMIFDSFHYGS